MTRSIGPVGRTAAACCVGALAVIGGLAQEAVTALRAAWVIDATGRPPIRDGVVVIRGRRIESVGPRASAAIPAAAVIVDLPHDTLLPGFVDTHSHLAMRIAAGGVQSIQAQRSAPPEIQMAMMLRNARVQLLCGVTTLRQCGDAYYNDIKIRDASAASLHPAPRIVSAGWPITNTGAHGIPAYWFDGPEVVRAAVRRNVDAGAEWIKLLSTDATSTSSQMAFEDIRAAVLEAHRFGVKVTMHTTGRWGSTMRAAIDAGVDTLEHARPLTDDLIKLMLEKGTTASLTPLVYIGGVRPPRLGCTWTSAFATVRSGWTTSPIRSPNIAGPIQLRRPRTARTRTTSPGAKAVTSSKA